MANFIPKPKREKRDHPGRTVDGVWQYHSFAVRGLRRTTRSILFGGCDRSAARGRRHQGPRPSQQNLRTYLSRGSPSAQVIATRLRNHPDREVPVAKGSGSPGVWASWSALALPVYGGVPLGGRTAGNLGASGAVGYLDPDHRLSVAFTINGVGGRRMYARYRMLGDLVQSALLPVGLNCHLIHRAFSG
jgi:hypothetical protein